MPIVLDGKLLSKEILTDMASRVPSLPCRPGLAVIMVGEDPGSQVYVARKATVAHKLGFRHVQVNLPDTVTEEALLHEIDLLNEDPTIHGLLVQLPLPAHIHREAVMDRVSALKDVDGVHPENVGLLSLGRPRFVPCTPTGIMKLLERWQVPIEGRKATVIGRSPIVGRPISLLLDRANATVTVCHSRTPDLEGYVRDADILVAAFGRKHAIPAAWIKPGAAVVDVGMHRLADGSLTGDVEPVGLDHAGLVSPVPGGVGPMTIAMLMANTLQAAELV